MARIALAYHDVVAPGGRSGFDGAGPERYKLEPRAFEAHLEAVASSGRRVGLVDDGGDEDVLLTFDDGGASSAAIARAVERHAWRAHFYVPTAHVGTAGFADAQELRDLRAAGHVVGAHGHTHRILDRLDDAEIADEWERSRDVLAGILGEEVRTASVPRGYASARVLRAAAAAGFEHVFTSEPTLRARRVGGAVVHGRFSVIRSTPPQHVAALARRAPVALTVASARWRVRGAAKTALGPRYELVRTALLRRR